MEMIWGKKKNWISRILRSENLLSEEREGRMIEKDHMENWKK